ncbi:MAG: DUF998 domain-containing protein [Bacillota bacterium]|jgi:hypothetical membrane protein|nr:DUF998 domain-containing protein [Bacillota bacterium]
MDSRLVRLHSLSGVVAAVFYFLHVYYGMRDYPGYSSLAQAVSDLTAVDAPSYVVASRLSALYSMFSVIGCTFVYLIVSSKTNKTFRIGIGLYTIMNWVSAVGYTLFPLSGREFQGTFQDVMHFYVVTPTVVLLSIVSLVLISVGGWRSKNTKAIAVLGLAALLSMVVGAVGAGVAPRDYFGVFERFSVYSVVIYKALLGLFGYAFKEMDDSQTMSSLERP